MHQSIQRIQLLETNPERNTIASHLFDMFAERRKDLLAMGAFFLRQFGNMMKVSVGIKSLFQKLHGDPPLTETDYARAPIGVVHNLGEFSTLLDKSTHHLWQYVEDFLRNGSGWVLGGYLGVFIDIYKLTPLRVGKYQITPRELRMKRGGPTTIVNIKTDDNFCFKWSVVATFVHHCLRECNSLPLVNAESVETYLQHRQLWAGLSFDGIDPGELTVRTAKIFEHNNPTLALNIYEYLNEDADLTPASIKNGTRNPAYVRLTPELSQKRKANIKPLCVSEHVHSERVLLHLLLLENPRTGDRHMVGITSLEAFFSRSTHIDHLVCPKCFNFFTGVNKRANYNAHVVNFCSRPELAKYNVDFKEDFIEFKHTAYFFEIPFQIIGDFETYTEREGRLNHSTPQRTVLNRQEIMGYSLKVITTPGVSSHVQHKFNQYTYNGEGAGKRFIEDFLALTTQVQHEIVELESRHKKLKPFSQMSADELELCSKKVCHICETPIMNNLPLDEWTAEQRAWKTFLTGNRFLRVDALSLPAGYWKGPKTIDHCHYRFSTFCSLS